MARNRLSSVANAARVLKSFSAQHPTWGVSELAASLDMSTSTTHRLLSTLADEGLLTRDAITGSYRLGLAVFDLAAAMPAQRTLHEAVLVSMTELRYRTGETVQVGVLDGREVVYVERLEGPNTVQMFGQLGRRVSAHRASSGKALLAFLGTARREALLDGWELDAPTPATISDLDGLRDELKRVRRQGFAENREESEPGVTSVAAPIRDAGGSVIAALSLAGPTERVEKHRTTYVSAVVKFAEVVSVQMGWTPDA